MSNWIILAAWIIAFVPFAEPHNSVHWRLWNANDGMVTSRSKDISYSPSPNHSLWIMNGMNPYMNLFDGFRFKRIKNPENASRPIQAGFTNDLWMLSSEGLLHYRKNEWADYKIPNMKSVVSFTVISKDEVLLTMEDRIEIFHEPTQRTKLLYQINPKIMGLLSDCARQNEETVWFSCRYGLARLTFVPGRIHETAEWVDYPVDRTQYRHLKNINVTPEGEVFAISKQGNQLQGAVLGFKDGKYTALVKRNEAIGEGWRSGDGKLWFHNYDSLFQVISENHVEISKEAGEVFDAELGPDGTFMLATSEGIIRYTPSTWDTPTPMSHLHTWVHAIREDEQGRLWFLSKDTLILYENETWKSYPFPRGYISHRFETEDLCFLLNGHLIFNTDFYSEFMIFDPEREEFSFLQHPDGLGIRIIAPKKDGTIWVRLQEKTKDFYQLATFDGESFQPYQIDGEPVEVDRIRSILEASNGDIWIGCLSSVWLIRNGKYKQITRSDGFMGDCGLFIQETPEGEIWIGDLNTIYAFDGKNWSIKIDEIDAVFSITTAKDGSVWVATVTGVYRYFNGSWIDLDQSDGISSNIVYKVYQDRKENIWLGTALGINRFYPELDTDPPITLIDSKDNPINIAADGNARFVFSGIDKWRYTEDDRLLYSYRLNEGTWSNFTTETVASFQELKPGEYLFEVRAIDRNLNIDPFPASFKFAVMLPWYQENGFIAIAASSSIIILVLIGLLLNRHMKLEFLVRQRTENLRQANAQLLVDTIQISQAEQKLRMMSSELTLAEERERRRIAVHLHDRIGHSLALLRLKLGELNRSSSNGKSFLLKNVLGLTEEMIEEAHSLTFELSPPILYELSFDRAVQWLVEEFQKKHSVKINLKAAMPLEPISEDIRILVFQIIRELLVNVAKHAGTDQANLILTRNNSMLHVSVQDYGKGFDTNSLSPETYRGYGLFSIRQRLQYVGGGLSIQSKAGAGTLIVVTAPAEAQELLEKELSKKLV